MTKVRGIIKIQPQSLVAAGNYIICQSFRHVSNNVNEKNLPELHIPPIKFFAGKKLDARRLEFASILAKIMT